MLDEPENAVPGPDTDIIAYAEPFVVSEGPVDVLDAPVDGEVLGTFEPESRVQARRISMDIATGDWWMYVQTQTLDGWLPLANLNRLSPEYR